MRSENRKRVRLSNAVVRNGFERLVHAPRTKAFEIGSDELKSDSACFRDDPRACRGFAEPKERILIDFDPHSAIVDEASAHVEEAFLAKRHLDCLDLAKAFLG